MYILNVDPTNIPINLPNTHPNKNKVPISFILLLFNSIPRISEQIPPLKIDNITITNTPQNNAREMRLSLIIAVQPLIIILIYFNK